MIAALAKTGCAVLDLASKDFRNSAHCQKEEPAANGHDFGV
jgi:hypothetical protein